MRVIEALDVAPENEQNHASFTLACNDYPCLFLSSPPQPVCKPPSKYKFAPHNVRYRLRKTRNYLTI